MPHSRTRPRTYRTLLTCIAATSASSLIGQYGLRPADDLSLRFEKGGELQTLATLGGLNHPQFSVVDVDGDGSLDYYAFDRAGDVHVAVGTDDAGAFVDKTAWVRDWPIVSHFAVLRDYDGDQIPDLFTSASPTGREGVLVYRGRRESDGRLSFTPVDTGGDFGRVLPYQTASDRDQLVYVARTDVPAIEDVDGDGDLDILAFDPVGTFVYLYRNLASERGAGGSDPRAELDFVLGSRCYGGVAEDVQTSELRLADNPGACASAQRPSGDQGERGGLHPGSTLTLYDLDGDGDHDALIGDVQTGELTALYNSPDDDGEAYFSRVEAGWPAGPREVSVALDYFPMAFPVAPLGAPVGTIPTNILVASNQRSGGEDFDNVWRYRSGNGAYELQTRSFLTDRAFDHGSGSHPASGQLDGRGAPELIVGNEGTYDPAVVGDARASLRYYACATDDACAEADPAWLREINEALAGPPQQPSTSFDPVLHDMDGDGDLDLLIGYSEGGVAYAQNTTRPGGAVDFALVSTRWEGIGAEMIQSSPAVADLNGDGLPDLVVGERNGNLNLFLNRGTPTAPAFPSSPDEEVYGGIEVRLRGFGPAQSRPAFVSRDGEPPVLYVGTAQGRLLVYGDLPPGPGGRATLVDTVAARVGDRLDPVLGYDAVEEEAIVLVGNRRGGVVPFRFQGNVPVAEAPRADAAIRAIPNPTADAFRVAGIAPETKLEVYDLLGERVATGLTAGAAALPAVLPKGVYVVVAADASGGVDVRLRIVKQ